MAAKSKSKGAGRSASLFPLMVFIGVCSVVAPPTMLVLACGMIPSVIAIFLNTSKVRGSIAAMFACNLAGVLPVVGFLWDRGHTLNQAVRLLSDPYMWLLMFGSAGVAGFLLWGVPIFVQGVYEVQAAQVVKRLQRRRAKLIEEWGGQIIEDAKIQPASKNNGTKK
ncbi:hypothetical protein [Sneathiella sp.]|jgi:hypothetical protein|uniref:hypothetical protein n=1 Tax=Sneathiella sp. TaxID=1964365 RepID=UPI0039E43513